MSKRASDYEVYTKKFKSELEHNIYKQKYDAECIYNESFIHISKKESDFALLVYYSDEYYAIVELLENVFQVNSYICNNWDYLNSLINKFIATDNKTLNNDLMIID